MASRFCSNSCQVTPSTPTAATGSAAQSVAVRRRGFRAGVAFGLHGGDDDSLVRVFHPQFLPRRDHDALVLLRSRTIGYGCPCFMLTVICLT